MIIKSISHHQKLSVRNLIKYVFDKRKPLLDKDNKPLYFKSHVRGYDKDKWIEQFNYLESNRKSKYANRFVVCYHEVVSFSPASTKYLENDRHKIKDLVNKYISLRSNDQLCIGATHFEKGKNYHVHLIFSGLRRDFFSARISKSRLESIKREVQEYQIEKYPELADSIIRLGLKKKCSFETIQRKKLN